MTEETDQRKRGVVSGPEGAVVSVRTRLQLLEREHKKGGRCPRCRDRPAMVLRFFRQDSPDGVPVPEEKDDDAGEPCPTCGWAPTVREIVEVVVDSREDVARQEQLGWER